MKKLLQLKTMLLLCALIVGSGSVWAADVTGNIKFGSGSGRTNVNSASVSGDDSQGNTWTITTDGTTSFTPNSAYAQIGSSSKPASSITFTTTLPYEVNINSFVAKFGGFGGTAGTVTLKVGDTTVGTGSLNATSDVTVSSSSSLAAKGTVLTVTVTSISKGVKAYYISYTYSSKPSAGVSASDIDEMITGTTMEDFYSMTADDYDGVLSFESDDESVAKVEEGVLKAIGTGTATITISADETEKYAPVSVSFDVTVKNRDAVAPEGQGAGDGYVLVTDASSLAEGDKLIIVNEENNVAMGVNRGNNRAAEGVSISDHKISSIGDDVQEITLEGSSGKWYFNVGNSNYLYAGGASSNNYLNTGAKRDGNEGNASISIAGGDASIVFNGSGERMHLRFNSSNSPQIFSCYASGKQSDVQLYRMVEASTFKTSISSSLWKTFVSAKNVSLPEGLEAYVVTAENTTSATLEKVTGSLKANTPYLLKADAAGDYTLTIEKSASAPASNLLQITDESTSNGVYVLANKKYGVGFYLWQGGNLGAGRVYLPAPVSGAREFISFDSDATSIEKIDNATSNKENGVVFNLAGQRVAQPSKGLYIVNGRKVIVK